jgi:hypothetical protein
MRSRKLTLYQEKYLLQLIKPLVLVQLGVFSSNTDSLGAMAGFIPQLLENFVI